MYFINIFSNYINDWQFIERLTTAVDQFELLLPLTLSINQFTFYVSSREVTKIPPLAQKPLPKYAFNVLKSNNYEVRIIGNYAMPSLRIWLIMKWSRGRVLRLSELRHVRCIIIFLRFKRWTSLMSFLPLTPALRVKLRWLWVGPSPFSGKYICNFFPSPFLSCQLGLFQPIPRRRLMPL